MPPSDQLTGPPDDEERCPECNRASAFGDLCRRCRKDYIDEEQEDITNHHGIQDRL